jgi:hypothetical protein
VGAPEAASTTRPSTRPVAWAAAAAGASAAIINPTSAVRNGRIGILV